MAKVKVLKSFEYGGKKRMKDEEVKLPASVAKEVVDRGYGEPVEEIPTFGEPEELGEFEKSSEASKETSTSGKGINVDRYAKSGGWSLQTMSARETGSR
ncbi:hypothetical protein AKJ47_01215 [candidate division MSBL1 archaeon SCGC-AAA261G05]|uniref:Uncharacterized protein n=2 Tax=candidate division MSBL1 TaxID=215777 RepID=A0A133VC23_9EURY|nr:hypothetical protein AKJ47_01215 [candidate division MSBL1 archaeon SCGC-AAA261G05]KXB04850.1 hypothetical protein AKJ48_01210 [candidate division MSBL1 archaeon SCGC-AAA261O19]